MIIVTGGAGFIGSNIVKGLNAMGRNDIIIVDHLGGSNKFNNLIDLDFIDYIERDDFMKSMELYQTMMSDVDFVIHQGACSDTTETDSAYIMAVNYNFTKILFEMCTQTGTDFIYASSAATYGLNADCKIDPNYENPLNLYGFSKLLFDRYIRKRIESESIKIVGLRYFNVYGPKQSNESEYSGVISKFIDCAVNNVRPIIYGTGEQYRDFIFVKDVARANIIAALSDNIRGGVFNVGTGKGITITDLWNTICSILNIDGLTPQFKDPRIGDIFGSEADITHCERVLGFTSTYELIDGLNETINWYNGSK